MNSVEEMALAATLIEWTVAVECDYMRIQFIEC